MMGLDFLVESGAGSSMQTSQGRDDSGLLDVFTVIKPGNTKEKVQIFTGGWYQNSPGTRGELEDTAALKVSPLDPRLPMQKNKGSWLEGDCSIAKRRKLGQRIGISCEIPVSPIWELEKGLLALDEDERPMAGSVMEKVSLLEQTAHKSLQKPSFLLTSRPRASSKPSEPLDTSKEHNVVGEIKDAEIREGVEVEDLGEKRVRVMEMVAQLECQKQSFQVLGKLSRTNSWCRKVNRIRLATQTPCDSSPETAVASEKTGEIKEAQCAAVECRVVVSERNIEKGGLQSTRPPSPVLSSAVENEEPAPGLLFFGLQSDRPLSVNKDTVKRQPPLKVDGSIYPMPQTLTHLQDSIGLQPKAPKSPASSEQIQTLHNRGDSVGLALEDVDDEDYLDCQGECCDVEIFHIHAHSSHKFMHVRYKLQQLLEAQSYLLILPHHVLVRILSLLPTHTLAAIKCTCHYLNSIIELYDIRPTDSHWVSEARYHDDPCKQCKKRYRQGDMSLCQWHPKPYCQALPYGPGYWFCCQKTNKDAPGCRTGVHDNRWISPSTCP